MYGEAAINAAASKFMPTALLEIHALSCCTFLLNLRATRKKCFCCKFSLFLRKKGSLFSQNAKKCLHLETFPFGEKIRVNEKPSNSRAQISLDEWL